MTKRRSIADARKNLPGLVREAETGRKILLTRRGDPVAVLIGRRDYELLAAKHRGFGEAYRTFAAEFDLAELAIDPDELFAAVRDETRGRDVTL